MSRAVGNPICSKPASLSLMAQIQVSDAPGLGITVDESALSTYRVDAATPTPQQLFRESDYTCRVHIPDGSGGEVVHDFRDDGCLLSGVQ